MKLVFRQHAIRRMFERCISVEDMNATLANGKTIENYPEDTPYPSRLLLGHAGARPLHMVAAENASDGEQIIITVYEPDPAQWEPTFTLRKKS